VIIKAAKRIFNSDKICGSYYDFYFGVTFFGTHCSLQRCFSLFMTVWIMEVYLYPWSHWSIGVGLWRSSTQLSRMTCSRTLLYKLSIMYVLGKAVRKKLHMNDSLLICQPSDNSNSDDVIRYWVKWEIGKFWNIARFFIYSIGNNVQADGDSVEISPQYLVRKIERMSLVSLTIHSAVSTQQNVRN